VGRLFAIVLTIIALVSAAVFLMHGSWLPADVATHGPALDRQMRETMIGTGVLFVLAQLSLALFVWRSGEGKADRLVKSFPGGATPLVVLATLLVGGEIVALTLVGSKVWASVYQTRAVPNELVIDLQAQQFAFYARYPGPDGQFGGMHPEMMNEGTGNFFGLDPEHDVSARDDIVAASLVLPVGRPIFLRMHAKDVGHGFYVPELRIQQDFVPGLDIPLRFTASKTGKFELVCTQLCGLGHYNMRAYVEVMRPEEFDKWLKDQAGQ
jgi:cytochrome c oxidase subunit II